METIENFSQYLFHILYALTFAFAVVKYPKYYDSVLKYFPIIIAYTLLTEILGWYILTYEDFQLIYLDQINKYELNNAIVYNIFDIIFYLYFFHLYRHVMKKAKHKLVIRYGAILFIIISIINPFLQDFRLYPQLYAIIAGSSILVSCGVLYIRQCSENDDNNLKYSNILFWISIGLLSFHPFYPVLMSIGTKINEFYVPAFNTIHNLLIIIMYACFIIGFLRMRRFKVV